MAVYQTLMNELKNSNTSGTYIQPVPIGLQVKLYYSEKGILTSVRYPIGDIEVELPFDVTVKLEQAGVLTQRLQTYKAKCEVFGVLVAPASEFKLAKLAGTIPICFYSTLVKLAGTKPQLFKFFALDVYFADGQTLPAAAALSRLAMMKFKTIPGIASYASSTANSQLAELSKIVKNLNPDIPLISGLYMHSTTSKLVSANLRCGKVSKISHTLDINGYIHGNLRCDLGEGKVEVSVPYNQVVEHNLAGDSFIILDSDSNIQYVSQPKIFSRMAPASITCPVCGKKYGVNPRLAFVCCVDPHCASKLYSQICRMLSKFNLPKLEPAAFTEYTKSGNLTTLHDVFSLPEYENCVVSTTLSNLLEAITLAAVLRGDASNMSKFVHQASSAAAVSYYIHNSAAIGVDLNLDKHFAANLQKYWADTYNVSTFDTFISSPHIEIIEANKKFDGDLIFRNKLICLTGEFKHGSYDDIISILKSYSGTSTVEFSPQVSFVLAGHFGRVDPYIIEKAQAYNIPVFEELEFFKAYQIDADLSKRHLI